VNRPSALLLLAVLAATPATALAQAPEPTQPVANPTATQPGLLFYLSGDKSFRADFSAGGTPDPNYQKDVKILPNGAKGSYIQCGNDQLLSYWAPGNIYSQRGTLSFYWRSRDPVDETEFPIFRVGYGDHSSWDMVWLRIDYNGHGFDAFVTDINLNRTRISVPLQPFPAGDVWTHIALSWDETTGIRFYINGKLAATKAATGMFDAALDQFGPHSRIISPQGVESSYNYDRGGDIDELRIYDRALSDDNIAGLAKNETPKEIPTLDRNIKDAAWQKEWNHNFGWNRPGDLPALLPAAQTTVRKVEIHDVYDLKRWWWKGTDGIRETSWPGVYNRSTLTGRFDYFQLPDWDCYSVSGKSVTFYLPDEPWNHLEIQGGAWGPFTMLTPGNGDPKAVADPDQEDPTPQLSHPLFKRPAGQERTTHDFATPFTGGHVHFVNTEQWWPIGEFAAYYVHPGAEPAHPVAVLRYSVTAHGDLENPSLTPLVDFIHNRFPSDERSMVVAMPGAAAGDARSAIRRGKQTTDAPQTTLPIVHILIPADFRSQQADEGHGATYSWENMHAGLDGIAIDLPAMNFAPTADGRIPFNIQIKDPLWLMRDMLDFSFSVKPGEPHTLWLDTRDRILPNSKSLYITLASASPEFSSAALEGMKIRLIFKPYEDALPEHIADRLTQVRDNYANMVEESVNSRKLNLFNRYDADITDLLRVDPTNDLGRKYWNELNHEQIRPPYTLPAAPAGVPEWAWLQTRDLGELSSLINWWVDNRQISDGEFGGGLSDDTDYMNWWPGIAMMGSTPDKLKVSLERGLDATFANDMWENGLAKAQYDELHSYEDGINTLGQAMQIDYGSPKQLERAMVTAKREAEWLTGYNSAGQRQIKTAYYSGTKMATGGVWAWAKERSYMVYHPALLLAEYNGSPEVVKMISETADGFLAHRRADANGKMQMHITVNFNTNEDLPTGMTPWFVLWGAYKLTGDAKYTVPFGDDPPSSLRLVNADMLDILNKRDTWGKQLAASNPGNVRSGDSANAGETNNQLAWQVTGDTSYLNKVYAAQLETAFERQFINRQGSLWIDRIYFNNGELQRGRLGGVALMRNYDFPGNAVSWRFDPVAGIADPEQSVGILVPIGTPDHIHIIAFNMASQPMTAKMSGWEVNPGQWEIVQCVPAQPSGNTNDINCPANASTHTIAFERSVSTPITFAPGYTVIDLKLKTPGTPYWQRYDLGMDPGDVKIEGNKMHVTVHSLGALAAPAAKLVVRDASGKTLAAVATPTLKPPTDLIPKTVTVNLTLPASANLKGATVTIESPGTETTQMNNVVTLP
jgi:hypothetical protein